MSPWIDEELTLFQDSIARFLQAEFMPHAERWSQQQRVDREAWLKAGQAGLLCVSIPEAYGGAGGHYGHEAIVVQALARAGLGGGFGAGNSVSSAVVAHYVLAYGKEEQKLAWLPRMARGEWIGAVAMTEPGAGSDLQRISTRAEPVEGGFRVTGQKTFITNGQNADLIVIVCKTDPAAGGKGISLLVLETEGAEGFTRGRNLKKIGMHAQDTSELFFQDTFIPQSHVLGVLGGGFAQLMQQLAWERMVIALDAVACMERALEVTLDYVRSRTAFGKQVIDYQNTQFKLAECKTAASVARVFVDELMVRLIAGELSPETAAMAKLWTTETQAKVIDDCLQLHGGYGYMEEYPIARLYADARATRIYGGTNEIMKMIIARTL